MLRVLDMREKGSTGRLVGLPLVDGLWAFAVGWRVRLEMWGLGNQNTKGGIWVFLAVVV
jgi:hypothetical protein